MVWTKDVHISEQQKLSIEERRQKRKPMGEEEKLRLRHRLEQYHQKTYTDQELLRKIQDFNIQNGRIPLKREFNAWDIYAKRFGSWNRAIIAAGFQPNSVLFAQKSRASDGHRCDSFTERVIDDWLHTHGIQHSRNASYGDTKFTADFKVGQDILIEFFGLAGVQPIYDATIQKKREFAKALGCILVEIYPDDIYPVNKLSTLLAVHGIS